MRGMEESVGNCPFFLVLQQLRRGLTAFLQLVWGGSGGTLGDLGAGVKLPNSSVLQSCLR